MRIKVELADTIEKQREGLMFRKNLHDDSGMLFKFSRPQVLNFWGLNTYIPLDVAFISPENEIIKITNIKPLSLKTVSSNTDCQLALEVNMGFFANNNIGLGDKIDIGVDNDGTNIVLFEKK